MSLISVVDASRRRRRSLKVIASLILITFGLGYLLRHFGVDRSSWAVIPEQLAPHEYVHSDKQPVSQPSPESPQPPPAWRVHESEQMMDLKKLFEDHYGHDIDDWRFVMRFNAPAMDRLSECILANTCGYGEQRIVILASNYFGEAWRGHRSGEHIWAHSTIEALTSLNYTLFYTFGAMDTLLIYQNLPFRLKHDVRIIWEGRLFEHCLFRNDTNYLDHEDPYSRGKWQVGTQACIKRDGYEEGIPIWNSFIFYFWTDARSPLGSQWTLAPENYATQYEHGRGNHYLGYSIESFCKKQSFTPHSQREHRALVLGKFMKFFKPETNEQYPWKNPQHPDQDILAPVIAQLPPSSSGQPFGLVGTARVQGENPPPGANENWKGVPMPVEVIQNLGVLSQADFYHELGKSKALLGVGNPAASPSPYDALCLGVPFINPIYSWDHNDPMNKFKWQAQHDLLRALDPPYVYNVRRGDAEGLEAAFKSALENPIESFIPPAMTIGAVRERHRLLVETDWRSKAKEYIEKEFLSRGEAFEYLL